MNKEAERPLRVLFIHHHGTAGGASASLSYLIKNFPSGAVHSIILTPPGTATDLFRSFADEVHEIDELPEITSIAGGKYYALRCLKTVLNYPALSKVEKLIQSIQPDLVHLNDLSLTLVARLCKRLGYKVVMHARVVLSDRVLILNRIILSLMRKYADVIIAIDGSVAGKLKDIPNIHVVYNPLHVKKIDVEDKSERVTCNCLFLANLIAYKGIFDLLEAAIILKDNPHVKIFIAGSNSRPRSFFSSAKGKVLSTLGIVKDIESHIHEVVRVHNLSNVVFLGFIKNINKQLSETDVLLFPSHMNGPSRSVFEAGALGIPSILALKDIQNDVVTNGVNGLIIPEKSPKALADAIQTLASDISLRKRLGQNAREHFTSLNDPTRSSLSVLKIYKSLLGLLRSSSTF